MPQTPTLNDNDDDDEDFPVLENVAKKGKSALIKTARTTGETISGSKIEQRDGDSKSSSTALSRSIATATVQPASGRQTGKNQPLSQQQIEHLIDEIVERHAEQMRRELHTILKHKN